MTKIRAWRPPKMPSNKPKPLPKPRLSRNFGTRFEIVYKGGPLHLKHHMMHHPCGTLTFSLHGQWASTTLAATGSPSIRKPRFQHDQADHH